ncbi:MAG: DoxX family protein [Haliscomenobacteraceae bacterium CHB4]|nr:putative oxidoreductase MhqP [Saprospiraceae bacterium]MCE7926837.1 DoxX family protein [Haliscomenobacteraceae bacterium CHB4]
MAILFTSGNDWTGLILRLTLGLIIFPHGAQKLLGWFGGYGFTGTMNFFTGTVHLPWLIGLLVILIEFFGSLFLIAGLGSRLWAIAMIVLMLGIIFTSHVQNGFFINWSGTQAGEGFEYHLFAIGLSLALLFNGSGKFSLDGRVFAY